MRTNLYNAPKTAGSSKVVLAALTSKSGILNAVAAGNPATIDVLVTVDVPAWIRVGPVATIVAVADGTDMYLVANRPYLISGVSQGDAIGFIAGGAGVAYITPQA